MARTIITILLACVGLASASAFSESKVGYINFGSFVLSEQVNPRNYLHTTIGYLPIGSLVRYDDAESKTIFNQTQDVQADQDYRMMVSNLGFKGYVEKSLITPLDDRSLLIPLRYKLIVRGVSDARAIGKLGRASGPGRNIPAYIVGEQGNNYVVEIEATQLDGEENFTLADGIKPVASQYLSDNQTTRGLIHKSGVSRDWYVHLDTSGSQHYPNIYGYSVFSNDTTYIDELISEASDNDNSLISQFSSHLQLLGDLQCRISAAADAAVSAKLFGTGFGFQIDLVVAEQDTIVDIKSVRKVNDRQQSSDYYQVQVVGCENHSPYRMQTISFINKNSADDHFHLKLNQFPEQLQSDWKTFQNQKAHKMFNITGYQDYELFMKHIDTAEFFTNMNQADRLSMKHYLLRETANFITPR